MEILLKNVFKEYSFANIKVCAVDHVDINIKKGDFVAIVGDSGSGKTTLLKLIGGLETVTGGEILINGVNIAALTKEEAILYRRENIGFIFQDYNLVDFLNIQDNILLPISLTQKEINREEYEHILEYLGISKLKCKYPNMLSGGEKQRVAIARAILMHPKVILADEPTGNLDSRNTKEVFELLNVLAKEYKQTVLMVTHNLMLAQQCDYILNMRDGKIYEE